MTKEKTCLELIQENYEKIRKKYKLPEFNEIDKEFELRKVDENAFIVKEIRRNILHKLQNVLSYLEPSLDVNPNTLQSFIEADAFTKKGREDALIVYRKIGLLLHKGLKAGISTEKEEIDFIKAIWGEWPKLKKDVSVVLDKIMEAWRKALPSEGEQQIYFG